MSQLNDNKEERKVSLLSLSLAFVIPFVIICIAFVLNKITPFGDNTLLIWNGELQLKDYYGFLWDALNGNADLAYSASKGLGGQMYGIFAYFLSSPLNCLLRLFEKSQISIFFSVITILKITLCGVTSNYFIRKRFDINAIPALMLSTSYALMEYNVCCSANVMWLDGALMLPLICIGVFEMLYYRKKSLLFVTVAISFVANWYSAFIACLMAGLYFLFELSIKYEWVKSKTIIKKALFDCAFVAVDTLLGIMAGAFVFLPGMLSYIGGRAGTASIFSAKLNWINLFAGFEINSSYNLPMLYCGGFALVLCAYFLFDRRLRVKTRFLSAFLLILLSLGYCLSGFEAIFSIFIKNSILPYAFSFTFVFAIIFVASIGMSEIPNNDYKVDKVGALKALLLLWAFVLALVLTNGFTNAKSAVIYSLILIVYMVLVIIVFNGEKEFDFKKTFSAILAFILVCAELSVNCIIAFNQYDNSSSGLSNYISSMQSVVEEINEQDNTFFRIEKNHSLLSYAGAGDSLMFGYNSIERYNSSSFGTSDNFLTAMGYSASKYTDESDVEFSTDTIWHNPILLTDSLLSVKYEMLTKGSEYLEKMNIDSSLPSGYSVYKNLYALSLAYNVSSSAYEKLELTENPFDNQQLFVNALVGNNNEKLYIKPSVKKGAFENGVEKYTLTAKTTGPMYIYISTAENHLNEDDAVCSVCVNGEYLQSVCMLSNDNIIYIGDYSADDEIELEISRITTNEKETAKRHKFYTAQLDINEFNKAVSILSSGYTSSLNISGNKITGTYKTNQNSTVMINLPYTSNWNIYVDSNKVSYSKIADTFIGIDLTAGSHTIEMVYKTNYKTVSTILTVLAILAFAVWRFYDKVIVPYNKKHHLSDNSVNR